MSDFFRCACSPLLRNCSEKDWAPYEAQVYAMAAWTTADMPEDMSGNQKVVFFFYETLFHTQQALKFVF